MDAKRWLELMVRSGGCAALCLLLAASGCGDDDGGGGGGNEDGGGTPVDDAGPTAGSGGSGDPTRDSGVDAGMDASMEVDSSIDSGVDAGPDPDEDAGTDEELAGNPAVVEEFAEVVALSDDDDDRFWAVTIHDGKIYAAGHVAVSGNQQMAVARFLPTGALDTTWGGGDGIATHDVADAENSQTESARGIGVQSDGKVVVVGTVEHDSTNATFPDADVAVVRFDADGALDATFEGSGVVILDLTTGYDAATGSDVMDIGYGLAIDGDDRIVIFASGKADDVARNDRDRFTVRLTADGEYDTTFGEGDGIHTFDVDDLGLNDNQRNGIVQADGKIVSAGYTNVAGRNQIALLRLNEDGTPDTTFSADGLLRSSPFSEGMAEAYGAVSQSDGKLVTTGYGRAAESGAVDLVSFRYTAAGMFDPSWGTGGGLVIDNAGDNDRGRNLAVLPDDRVVEVGSGILAGGDIDAMVVVTDENGDLDPAFNGTGQWLKAFGGTDDAFYGVAVSGDGSLIVAAGYSSDGAGPNDDDATLAIFSVEED